MINIYQLFPRLFGNKKQQTVIDGTIEQNGCGKFDDVSNEAIAAIKDLGITHIWLTGIIRHASLTSYKNYGIPESNPSIVKGRAGSPYAICDYYDVDPDLAIDVPNRMQEFRDLIDRIHKQNLKVIIDFVPNHLARGYKSIAKPAGIKDFGEDDNTSQRFGRDNNFYYLPGESFVSPNISTEPFYIESDFNEFPAKATGNDCFTSSPTLNDWYETVKLNYGFDYEINQLTEGDSEPDSWKKMLHIIAYWSKMGVDGFRVDMAEMIPVEFFAWMIPSVKNSFPELTFIAEIYQPHLYKSFVDAGFDFLYDKVGMYNRMYDVLRYGHAAESISICWKMLNGLDDKMVRFMENHDEVRLASRHFVGEPFAALPAVAVSALMHRGPFMIYNGQESGEQANGISGYSGDDGRTSIFDYCTMPLHQKWMNGGKFDDQIMDQEQKKLFSFYKKILHLRIENEAFSKGDFYDLMWANPWFTEFDPRFVYAFLRYTHTLKILVVANFHRTESRRMRVNIPEDAIKLAELYDDNQNNWVAENLLDKEKSITFEPETLINPGLQLNHLPLEIAILHLHPITEKLS
jgi:glycosidase